MKRLFCLLLVLGVALLFMTVGAAASAEKDRAIGQENVAVVVDSGEKAQDALDQIKDAGDPLPITETAQAE